MVGNLLPLQTISHLIISNKFDTCTVNIDNPFIKGEKIDLNLKKIKSPNINIDLINNTPYITIDLKLEATIDSSGQNFNYTIKENIDTIEKEINKYMENLLKEYLYLISKEYNSDIIGFGGIYSAKFKTAKDFNKIHWNEIFSDSFFDVNVESVLTLSHLFNKE